MLGVALALALAAPPAPPPAPTPPAAAPSDQASNPAASQQIWLVTDTKVAFTPVPIAFPLKAGVLSATNHAEASHQGENLDNAIQYRSSDQAVFGTIYIYYPGLPHAGLAALAQDWAIRNNTPAVTGGALDLGPAGGVNGVAVRTAYSRYRNDLASMGAFMKVGRWIVAVRVSGPEARKAEVEAAMQALLDGIQFGRSEGARLASRMVVRDCGPIGGGQHPANIVPDPQDVAIAAKGMLGTFDGGGIAAKEEESGEPAVLPSRVPDELCRSDLKVKSEHYVLLRGLDGPPISIDGRSVRLVLLSDSGKILEVDHAPKLGGYVLLFHDLGETDLLGTYDSIPTDKQLADILDGTDHEGARIHIPVHLRPGHGADIMLPPGAPAATGGATGTRPPATSSR